MSSYDWKALISKLIRTNGGHKAGYWGYLPPPPRILGVNTPP